MSSPSFKFQAAASDAVSALRLKRSLEVRYEDNHENYCASTLTCVGDDVTVKGFVQFAAALDKQFMFDLAVEALTKGSV